MAGDLTASPAPGAALLSVGPLDRSAGSGSLPRKLVDQAENTRLPKVEPFSPVH